MVDEARDVAVHGGIPAPRAADAEDPDAAVLQIPRFAAPDAIVPDELARVVDDSPVLGDRFGREDAEAVEPRPAAHDFRKGQGSRHPPRSYTVAVNLMLLEPQEVDGEGVAHLTGARARHATEVLKVVPEDDIRIGVVDGPAGVGRVESVSSGTVVLRCRLDGAVPPRPRVDLLLALPRPKVMKRLWAQLAALGVGRIILTNAERVERDYFGAHVLGPGTHRPLLVEGLQQARDTRLPLVSIHRQFRPLVEDRLDELCGPALRLLADPAASLGVAAAIREAQPPRVLIAVGPEGGWNDFERRLLEARGFRAVGLGPRTLRTDAACIALLALVHDALTGRTVG